MNECTGVIYILTNPSFPQYVKIGYASDLERRLRELNRSASIPFAFRVYATYDVVTPFSDLILHSLIDNLNPNLRTVEEFEGKRRVREFYEMTPEYAYSILKSIAKLHFAFGVGHRCVCERPLGTDKRPPQIEGF